ncbi:Uncharacterised protein [Mycobacteroides abscessus subsp. abscessus]|nr:Uncharacterised protein [Mycobacteroides abscessus subsp. abscessus]
MVNSTVSPACSTCNVHSPRSEDHSAPTTLWPNRTFSATPNSRAVSVTYSRMEVPSAMPLVLVQGRKL